MVQLLTKWYETYQFKLDNKLNSQILFIHNTSKVWSEMKGLVFWKQQFSIALIRIFAGLFDIKNIV